MFITNNQASLRLWWKENLLIYQNVSKYYEHDCSNTRYFTFSINNLSITICFLRSPSVPVVPWCGGYHNCSTSFNWAWTQVPRGFKNCLRRFEDSKWLGSRTMVPAGNKAKRFLLVSITTKIANHCHHYHGHHHHHQRHLPVF